MNSPNPITHLFRLLLVTALAPALNASAQSTWTNSAGGNWSGAGNWSGGAPVSGGTTILNFTTAGAYAVT